MLYSVSQIGNPQTQSFLMQEVRFLVPSKLWYEKCSTFLHLKYCVQSFPRLAQVHFLLIIMQIFPFSMFKRLHNHYSFLDSQTVPQSATDCRPLHPLRAAYHRFIACSTVFVIHFLLSKAYQKDDAARFALPV